MNDKHQENGILSGPLILSLPAYHFVAILRRDLLNGPDATAVPLQNALLGVGSGTDGFRDWAAASSARITNTLSGLSAPPVLGRGSQRTGITSQ